MTFRHSLHVPVLLQHTDFHPVKPANYSHRSKPQISTRYPQSLNILDPFNIIVSHAPTSSTPASNTMGPKKLPVISFSLPTIGGAMAPPSAPIELINAMAPASAAPLRNFPGSAQNGPRVE